MCEVISFIPVDKHKLHFDIRRGKDQLRVRKYYSEHKEHKIKMVLESYYNNKQRQIDTNRRNRHIGYALTYFAKILNQYEY